MFKGHVSIYMWIVRNFLQTNLYEIFVRKGL
jgi:hypothetical protein